MPAWRILICVFFAIGFTLSAQAASSGSSTISIVVSHVPTLAVSDVDRVPQASSSERAYCVNASLHASPHRLVPVSASGVAPHAIAAGRETCFDAQSDASRLALYRIVPE